MWCLDIEATPSNLRDYCTRERRACFAARLQDNEENSLVHLVVQNVNKSAKFTIYNMKTRQLRGARDRACVEDFYEPLRVAVCHLFSCCAGPIRGDCAHLSMLLRADCSITPRKGWGGKGILGLVARYDSFAIDEDHFLFVQARAPLRRLFRVSYYLFHFCYRMLFQVLLRRKRASEPTMTSFWARKNSRFEVRVSRD